jgi:hypothetical protein
MCTDMIKAIRNKCFYRDKLVDFSFDGQWKKYFILLAVTPKSLINLFYNFQSLDYTK